MRKKESAVFEPDALQEVRRLSALVCRLYPFVTIPNGHERLHAELETVVAGPKYTRRLRCVRRAAGLVPPAA
jgi:hypothetical protein